VRFLGRLTVKVCGALFQKLLQPFTYILQVPGKQIRAKLAHAFNYWLKISADKLLVVGDIVQMLHNSSLL
jgi:geranylgeranyl diphosphate synthase type 3